MLNYLIVFQSQTQAIKAIRLLERYGVAGYLTRPPRDSTIKSCAWAVRVRAKQIDSALMHLKDINYERVCYVDNYGLCADYYGE